MRQAINTLKAQLKIEEYNLSILPEHEKELKKITWLKIDSINLAITCLELVSNNINPFTNGAFCNKKNKK